MTDLSKPEPDFVDKLAQLFELPDGSEARLRKARTAHPLGWALVMAALCWDQMDRHRWKPRARLCAQARRLMAAWGLHAEWVDDPERVSAALQWAMRRPALLESDDQDRYQPVGQFGLAVCSHVWDEHLRTAMSADVLTPLELVARGDTEGRGFDPDPDAAERSYRLAMDSDDPDAAAIAALRLAQLAEESEQPAEAARRYTEVAALRHPLASPPALLWLARAAAEKDDRPTAHDLARQLIDTGDEALEADAWGILGSLAWHDGKTEEAIAAMRRGVATAGELHGSFSRALGAMLTASGDLAGAAEAYRRLLDQPLLNAPDIQRYVQLMAVADRLDEAVAVLEQRAAQDGPFVGDMLLALAGVHITRDDHDATRQVLRRIRGHWSVGLPQVAVRADVVEASLAATEGDDDRAAELFRSLTNPDDPARLELARPLLLTSGEQFAKQGRLCMIPGARPLLEYLAEDAPRDTAVWAATSLAHMDAVDGRFEDAEVALRLAARHLSREEVTLLRARLLRRGSRESAAVAWLIDLATTETGEDLLTLLAMLAKFVTEGVSVDFEQRDQLRAVVDRLLGRGEGSEAGASQDEPDGMRQRLALAMAQVEVSWYEFGRAVDLWEIATESDDPPVASWAWYHLGVTHQLTHARIAAAHAFEQAMRSDEATMAGMAATQLARIAENAGDNTVLMRACSRALELTSGDDWAQAALRLGWVCHYDHPDDAEVAYHSAIAEPAASPATVGTALARLGALYALHGNRRLAQRFWRRGKHHRDPGVAEAFAAERATIGRVMALRGHTAPPP